MRLSEPRAGTDPALAVREGCLGGEDFLAQSSRTKRSLLLERQLRGTAVRVTTVQRVQKQEIALTLGLHGELEGREWKEKRWGGQWGRILLGPKGQTERFDRLHRGKGEEPRRVTAGEQCDQICILE